MLNVRVKKALLTILTACLTVLMTIGAILGFTPTTQTAKAADGTWTLVKNVSDLKVDDQVIIVAKNANFALSTTQNTNNRAQAAVTKSGDTLTFTSSVQVLTLKAGTSSGTFAFYTGSGYLYAASSSSNHLKTQTSLNANGSWKIEIATSGVATIKANGSNTRNLMKYNPNNGSPIFSCYSSGQNDVCIYKWVVADSTCEHPNAEVEYTTNKETKEHTSVTTCPDCNAVVSEKESCSIQETNEGLKCVSCEAVYATYTIPFIVPDVVDSVENMTIVEGETAPLPTAENYDKYTFVGWTTSKYAPSEDSPVIYTTYNKLGDADVTLYALYTYAIPSDITGYVKVTNAGQLKAGDEVVIVGAASTHNVALGTTQSSNNRKEAAVTKSDNTVTFGSDVQVLTLAAGTKAGTFAFHTGSGYLYAAGGGNYLRTQTTNNDNGSWEIEIDEKGVATIKAQGTNTPNWLRYNPSAKIFSCYASGQSDICIYKYTNENACYTTYVTTAIASASLTLGEELTMNYKVAMDDTYAGAEMTFTMADNTTTVTGTKVDGLYVYSLQVAPQYMGENITAELKLGDTVLATKATYSVKEYAESLINDEKSTNEVKLLASDLLLYGAAAQAHTGHDTGNLVADLENLGAAPTTTDFSLVNAEVENGYPVYFTGANLNFSSLNTLYVTLSKYDEKVELYVNGDKVDLINNIYSTGTLQATQFNDTFTFVLKYDGIEMQTLTYSVNAYAYQFASGEGTMADLARALYNYGASVEAYVATLDTQN